VLLPSRIEHKERDAKAKNHLAKLGDPAERPLTTFVRAKRQKLANRGESRL